MCGGGEPCAADECFEGGRLVALFGGGVQYVLREEGERARLRVRSVRIWRVSQGGVWV